MLMHGFQLCQLCNVSSECFHNIPLVVRSRERFILKGEKNQIIISAPESQVKKGNSEGINAILPAQTPNHPGFCPAPFIYHFNYRRDLLLQRATLCLFSREGKSNLTFKLFCVNFFSAIEHFRKRRTLPLTSLLSFSSHLHLNNLVFIFCDRVYPFLLELNYYAYQR